MPRKRKAENAGLPKRWQYKHGAYYFQVPVGKEKQWDGKRLFRLGSTEGEAYREWANRIDQIDKSTTMAALCDRYAAEHMSTLAAKTQASYRPALKRIRKVFRKMECTDMAAHDANTFFDKVKLKHGLATARGDIAVLRGMLSQALRWGVINSHPMIGLRFEQVQPANDELHQWQVDAMLSINADNRTINLAQHYVRLKLMLGLRRGDMLRLKLSDFRADGLHCELRKTQKTSGVKLFVPWADPDTGVEFAEFRNLVDAVRSIAPKRNTDGFLFSTKDGDGFVDEDTGRADGFDSLWRRFMTRVIADTDVTARIKEKSLRSFVADESGTVEQAAHRLGHTSSSTTERHYRKRARTVLPLVDSGKTKPCPVI